MIILIELRGELRRRFVKNEGTRHLIPPLPPVLFWGFLFLDTNLINPDYTTASCEDICTTDSQDVNGGRGNRP